MHETDSTTDAPTREAQFIQYASAAGRPASEVREAMRMYPSAEAYASALLREMDRDAERRSASFPFVSPTEGGDVPSALLGGAFLERATEAIYAPEGHAAKETTRRLSRDLGISARGNLVPLRARTLTSTGVATGKELTVTLQGDFVDLMRPRLIAAQFGAELATYWGGNISRPTLNADAAFSWLGENPGSGVAASDPATGAVTMTPRAVATRTTHTAQSLRTSSPDTAQLIMQAHAARLAVAVDAAVLAGRGPTTYNEPTGILNASGVNVVAMGTNGAVVSYAKLCELEQAVDIANAPIEGLGFVTTPEIRSRMRQTMDFPSAAAGRPLWTPENTVLGHNALTTTSMPNNLTKGTSSGVCHSAILGDFSQVVIGYWGALDVIVDPYTDAAKGLTHITSTLYVDVGVLRPAAFAVIRDLTLS